MGRLSHAQPYLPQGGIIASEVIRAGWEWVAVKSEVQNTLLLLPAVTVTMIALRNKRKCDDDDEGPTVRRDTPAIAGSRATFLDIPQAN